MILERVGSEHMETVVEIVFTNFVLLRIFKNMEIRGLQRFQKVCFCFVFYSLAQLDSRFEVLVHSFAVQLFPYPSIQQFKHKLPKFSTRFGSFLTLLLAINLDKQK